MIITGNFPILDFERKVLAVELLYLLSFALIIFFFLTNFFLAIVVDGYVKVSKAVAANDAENSIVVDLYDIVLGMIKQSKHRWPSPDVVLQHLLRDQGLEVDTTNSAQNLQQCLQLDETLPPVTAEELAGPKAGLMSADQAQLYLAYYAGPRKNVSTAAQAMVGAPGREDQLSKEVSLKNDLQARAKI